MLSAEVSFLLESIFPKAVTYEHGGFLPQAAFRMPPGLALDYILLTSVAAFGYFLFSPQNPNLLRTSLLEAKIVRNSYRQFKKILSHKLGDAEMLQW